MQRFKSNLKALDTLYEKENMYFMKTFLLGDLLVNYDSKRIPLSSKQRELRKGEYPYYGAQGIIDFVDGYLFDGEYMLIAEDGENLRSRNLPIANIVSGKFWINNHAHIVTNNEKSDLHFIYYWLNYNDISEYITGSAQPKLSQSNMNAIKIPMTSLPVQIRIAEILSSFDDKLQKNNEYIETVESIIQSIYKSWFCEFEYPNSIGQMKYSEKLCKHVPFDWKEKQFGTFLIHHSEKIGDEIAPIYSTTNRGVSLRDEKFDKTLSKSASNNKKVVKNDLMFGLSRQILNLGIMPEDIGSVSPVYTIFKIDSHIYLPFLLEIEMRINMPNYMDILRLGAREGQGISKDYLLNKYVLVPSMDTQKQFEAIYTPLINKISKLKEENTILAEIRDTLLLKLMSGELPVEVK